MEEFRQQEYIPPENVVQRAAGHAGAVLSSIRDRLARPARTYETDAPVYSADTYDQSAAPDLGWEAAFDPNAVPAQPSAPSAQDRFEAFRNTVYDSPYRQAYGYRQGPAPMYEEISFSAPPRRETASYAPPVYEEIRFTAPPPRENNYKKPVYEELDLSGRPTVPQPQPQVPYPPEETAYPQTEQPGYGPVYRTDPGLPVRQAADASDFQYFFWSVSILAGAALTLFSFVYACVV